MATNTVGCIVQNSIYHSAHADEDAEEDESSLIHIKASPLVHVHPAVSEIELPSACCLKKFSGRFQKDYCLWEMPSSHF